MNKYTELLEKHVQWVALGIGGLWLLFMVYTHVIVAESSSVDVAGEKVGAASVDKKVQEKAQQLREKIERQDKLPDQVGKYADAMAKQLQIETPSPWSGEIVAMVPGQAGGPGIGAPPPPPPGKDIHALPIAPKANNIDALALRSVVKLPLPPQPGQQPGQPVEGEPQLLSYVVVAANFPMAELGKEFKDKITQPVVQLHQTVLLKVELVREELLPDGSWSKPVVIPTHDFGPQVAPPVPWPQNNRAEQMNFAQQATANQPSLAQPKFVTAIRGDQWRLPGQPAAQVGGPNVPAPAPAPEDVQPMPGPARQPGGRPVNPNPGGNGPRRPPIPGRERTDASPALPKGVVAIAQVFDEPPPRRDLPAGGGGLGGGQPPAMGVNPGVPAGGIAAPAIPPANLPGEAPKVAFDPENASVFPIWVHDITVVPGKTYRYRMRYTIKNPVFAANNVCKPPTLGDVFAIDSELSEPTKSITIPNTTMYFAERVRMVSRDATSVDFAVFTWTVNGLVPSKITAVPGDMIDPNLKVTLVDIRDQGRTIILMDENGSLTTRNYQVDSKSQEFKDAEKTVADQAIAPVAGR